jgi:hypothetical protein
MLFERTKTGRPNSAISLWTLTDAKMKYNTYHKEVYAHVQALKQWCHYIMGKKKNSTMIIIP